MTEKKARLVVRGQVQGVGYRFFASKKAQELGVRGWIKNNPDGTVEAAVESSGENIEQFIHVLRSEHPWAKVNSIEIEWQPFDAQFQDFKINY